ncbi:hypothetical protein [Rhabdothermincola sediminis]|uniref:hypothetical protein n=1 Tax=Rhabdothermincola sediminis TaxID=2751370 RepID=UPI001AA049C6|nr:hypothetical protein [Rhabdothermincola sediminis]
MPNTDLLLALAIGSGVVAAVRSTWSPCGQSMLSSITPVAEAGRGHRFGSTATFFLIGALIGGLVVGSACALLAAGVALVDPPVVSRFALIALGAFTGVLVDAGFTPWRTPFLRRQVNEDWLSAYRAWFYGGGFGFQIGTGVMTYVMSTAVPLTIALAVLTGSPARALVVCVAFAAVRGSAIFLTSRCRSFVELQRLHRRFECWREPVRRLTIVWLGTVSAVAAVTAWSSLPAGLVLGAVAVVAVLLARPADLGTDPAFAVRPTLSAQALRVPAPADPGGGVGSIDQVRAPLIEAAT